MATFFMKKLLGSINKEIIYKARIKLIVQGWGQEMNGSAVEFLFGRIVE